MGKEVRKGFHDKVTDQTISGLQTARGPLFAAAWHGDVDIPSMCASSHEIIWKCVLREMEEVLKLVCIKLRPLGDWGAMMSAGRRMEPPLEAAPLGSLSGVTVQTKDQTRFSKCLSGAETISHSGISEISSPPCSSPPAPHLSCTIYQNHWHKHLQMSFPASSTVKALGNALLYNTHWP